MLHFLIGFYFGGALSVFLSIITTAKTNELARDLISDRPLDFALVVFVWPYYLIRGYTLVSDH